MVNTFWSQLRPLSKPVATIMKTAFLLSLGAAENHHVIQSYLNHKGAHFKIINRGGEREESMSSGHISDLPACMRGSTILCRQTNIEKINFVFLSKSDLEIDKL